MRVMVMVKATMNSEAGVMPSEKLLAEMGKFNEELLNAGVMLTGDRLHPSRKGKRVRFAGGKKTIIDGPFAETRELLAGYWIWQVRSMEEAIEWVGRCPDPMPGEESEIEIRPREGGRGGGDVLCLDLPGFPRRPGHTVAERLAKRTGGHCEGRGLHPLRPAVPGDQRGASP